MMMRAVYRAFVAATLIGEAASMCGADISDQEQRTKLAGDKLEIQNICVPNYPAPSPKGFDCQAVLMGMAKRGNAVAQFTAGLNSAEKKDYASAIAWLEKSASQGYPAAMTELGRIYSHTESLIDSSKAMRWFGRSADTGDAEGMAALADAYMEGKVTTQNVQEAIKLYEESAKAGRPSSAFKLATIYGSDQGVTPDPVQSLRWYIISCSEHVRVEHSLRNMGCIGRDIHASSMSPADVQRAQAMAADWNKANR